MIFDKEFIWYKDHYVYHITERSSMSEIKEKGLISKLGLRSLSVDDKIKTIHFFDGLYSAQNWIDDLYGDREDIELLRFNIKRRKWLTYDVDDFYTLNRINPNKIQYLTIYNNQAIKLPLQLIEKGLYNPDSYTLEWKNIESYQLKKYKN